jgi:5,10-methylene-tetrahydrofolate dehydrogenase/methenyl tetrahydrofolate cyclohydrolase
MVKDGAVVIDVGITRVIEKPKKDISSQVMLI